MISSATTTVTTRQRPGGLARRAASASGWWTPSRTSLDDRVTASVVVSFANLKTLALPVALAVQLPVARHWHPRKMAVAA